MIDVVIATYQRPQGLRNCLVGLSRQSESDFRVVVVDDSSPEPVAEWLRPNDYPFALDTLRTAENSGPAHARNLAAKRSDAEFIAFIDDDVVPTEDLLSRHRRAHVANGPHSVVIGPLASPPDWRPTPWNRWEAETIAVEYERMRRGDYEPTWRQFFTGNAFLRRTDFLAAGGFNEQFLRAEDIELAYRLARLGCHFVFEPEAKGWHYSERSLASWRKIPQQYAWSDAALAGLYPDLKWRELVARERSRRNPVTRTADAVLGAISARTSGASAAIFAARLAAAVRAHFISSPLLSLAYELEYSRTSERLSKGQGINTASTAAG